MIVLDDASRSIVNLLFGLVGVWMAHAFYHSPRKRWEVITAWITGFAYCTAAAALVEWCEWIPYGTHEHLSNAIGFGAIFVYIYLFPQIPIVQRIFTYFFIDNSIYILVLLSRLAALRLTGTTAIPHSTLFVFLFLLLTAAFLWLFVKKLKDPILQGLSAFRKQLSFLTVYACVAYMAMLALVDPWGPLKPRGFGQDLAFLLLSAATVCGYVLAFHLMRSSLREQQALAETREITALLAVSQRYYGALVERIEQERTLRHDFIHHLRAMDAMQKDGRQEYLGKYLAELLGQTESKKPVNWCACYVANVLLDYYATQAQNEGIDYAFDASIPECDAQESAKLCVVLGNLLQNALEACRLVPDKQEQFISLLARVVNGNLTIEVKNSFDGVVEMRNGNISSRKAELGHGLGLKSVRSVVESGNGYFEATYNEESFTAKAVLPLPVTVKSMQIS